MKNTNQLISILLPVRNAAVSLPACLDSLFNQSYANFEIIVIDDFSKDKTRQILHRYKRLAGKKLKVYRNVKRYGLSISLNRALRKAEGKFITFMDPRDISTRDKLKRQLNFLLNNPKTVAVGTQCVYIDEENRKVGKSQFPLDHNEIARSILSGQAMKFTTALINRYLLPKDLLYFQADVNHLLYAHLFVKLLQYGPVANLNQCFCYHIQSSKTILQSLKRNFVSYATLWAKARFLYDLRLPATSLFSPLVKLK